MKTLMIAAAAFATLIVTSVTDADAPPWLPRRWVPRRWLPRRGRRSRVSRRHRTAGLGRGGTDRGAPGLGRGGPARLGRGGPNRRPAGLGALWISALWRLSRLRLRLSSVRLWLGGGRGCGRSRRRVLRRLRAICLLQLILRRLSLLLTGNTSIDEGRFEAITSPAGGLGG